MKKFQELISDNTSASLKRRAAQIATSAEIAQQNLVNAIKQEKTNIELKIEALKFYRFTSSWFKRLGCS